MRSPRRTRLPSRRGLTTWWPPTRPALQAFRTVADGSAASTNISADKVLCFGNTYAVLDARSFYIWQKGNRAAGLAEFQKKQGIGIREGWPSRRSGRTVNHSGIWPSMRVGSVPRGPFGRFCLVTSRITGAGRSTAVFPGDSLQRYTTVVGPPLPLSDLDEVRLPASYLDTLKQYERLNLARRPLTQTQANELAAFRLLQGWRRTYGIAITPLP